tara:strand:+ start:320 stop:490 length:171 start_codon:yes stop_codon:yes gene_type:complete
MPFAYQLPPLPPNQATFIETRISVPVFEYGIKDGTPYSTSYFVHPEIKNPFYNDGF